MGGRASTDVLVWVADPGPGAWTFTARWRDHDRPLAQVQILPQTASTALVRVTEDAERLPDLGLPEEMSTLVVTASGEGWDPLERYLRVVVAREGLFVDATGCNPDGTFHLDATGAGRPTDVDVRVYARDAAGRVALDAQRSAAVEWTPAGEERSAGRTALDFPEFGVRFAGMRASNRPSATFRLAMGRKLPTSGQPIAATLSASVPGTDDPAYTRLVALSLDGVDMSPYSPAWQEEQAECLKIIEEFAPRDQQAHLRQMVYERGPKIGAEAMHELRRRIWSLSENALRAEAADYLTKAWTYEQAQSVLDWASWCGDIALAVVSGRITGTAAGIAVGLLKPVLVSAINAYLDGKSLEDWAKEQVLLVVSVAEGQFTDPDFLEKMTGASKAKVWAAFIAYTFCKEWYLDPEHRIREAAWRTLQMLRDRALIHFLRQAAGTLPQKPPSDAEEGPEASGSTPKKPAASAVGNKAGPWNQKLPAPESPSDSLARVNPNFKSGKEWRQNCPNCCFAYDARRRGLNVTAGPLRGGRSRAEMVLPWTGADGQPPALRSTRGRGFTDILEGTKDLPDGARGVVAVNWEGTSGGHAFMWERRGGKTVFLDPQSGNPDASSLFLRARDGRTQWFRTDDCELTYHDGGSAGPWHEG